MWYLRQTLKNIKMAPSKIKAIQNKRISNIINYSYKNVGYYRKAWNKQGIKPNDIKSIEDLKKLPTINKKIVFDNYWKFVSTEYRKYVNILSYMPSFLFTSSTSGTSGRPFIVYFNPNAKYFLDAVYARDLLALGYNPTKLLVCYWWQQTQEKRLYNFLGLFNTIYVQLKLNEEAQLDFMKKIKPEYIYYFPSSIYFISRLILNQNIGIDFKPKFIITRSEILSENMRKTIENAFSTNVYDQYGTGEFNRIAWECNERNGYHMNSDSVVVEIVDKNYEEVGDGELGKILVTGLINKAFPLIRYEVGDFVIKSESDQKKHKCGINLPVGIKSVEGRYEHSIERKNKLFTQKKMVTDIVNILDKKRNVYKFQAQIKSKLKKISINYTLHKNKLIKGRNSLISGYKTEYRNVHNINKNNFNGKILIAEKVS